MHTLQYSMYRFDILCKQKCFFFFKFLVNISQIYGFNN